MTAQTVIVCPECGSDKSFKDGKRHYNGLEIQRFLCRECSLRFSDPASLKVLDNNMGNSQIGAKMAKNLTTTTKTEVVGDNAKIDAFLEWMKRQGYKQTTIDRRQSALLRLQNLKANLDNPETVKETISKQTRWKESQKQVVVFAYDLYAKHYGLSWDRPKYEAIRELPFIPQEREIDDLIAGVNKEIGLLLLIAKETGARAGEIYGLLWTDIDFEAKTLSIRAEKRSNPRRFTLKPKLLNMLETLP